MCCAEMGRLEIIDDGNAALSYGMEDSPFLNVAKSDRIASNELAFDDRFPVTRGHALMVTHRVVPTWFDASTEEQVLLTCLVNRQTMTWRLALPVPQIGRMHSPASFVWAWCIVGETALGMQP